MLAVLSLCMATSSIKTMAAPMPEAVCRTQQIEGVNIFYREAGPQTGPVLVLLHGFPSSSFYFRNLIPLLAGKYHVIYMQDYGAPVGMRIAVKHPQWIRGLVFQNGNIYQEGLLERFFLKKPLWEKRTGATEAPVLRNMEFDSVKFQYVHGARHPEEMSPDAWTMDAALLERPGNKAIQLELQADYGNNLTKYPEWQAYLRKQQPPTLVVWGKNDPIFGPKGAEAFRRDVPGAEIHLLDTGHFALEEDYNAIADFMLNFLDRQSIR